MYEQEHQIVFVVGSGRSGTTLLRQILNLDDRISVCPELNFFDFAYPRYRSSKSSEEFAGIVMQALRRSSDPMFEENDVDFEEVFETIKSDSSPREVFYHLLSLTSSAERGVVVEKSPNNVFHLDAIQRLFPEAKFIHMYRDGREFCASAKKNGWSERLETLAVLWNESIRAFDRFKYSTKCDFVEIRYEDLVSDPDREHKKLYKLLNLEKRPSIDDSKNLLTSSSSFKKNKTMNGLYQSSNFNTYFTVQEQNLITFYLKNQLKRMNFYYNEATFPRLISYLRFLRSTYVLRLKYYLSNKHMPHIFTALKKISRR